VSHSKEKISSIQKSQAQSFASGSFKMHMTNGASFNLTNKKHTQNFDNISNGDGSLSQYHNQVFVASNGSEGNTGFNAKNNKNVLSGPINSKNKPVGSSHMEMRDKKMKDAYKNAKPKSKGGMNSFNNQAALQYSQNNFIQNKPQFSTFYGQGQLQSNAGNNPNGLQGMSYAQLQIQNALLSNNASSQNTQYEYSIEGKNGNMTAQNIANQFINSKINPSSGGIPISQILPHRNNNSELNSYQSEKKLRGFNNNQI
jgi:hypothetical protein